MKTLYFIFPVLLLAGLKLEAQLTLTKAANEPVSGDVHTMVSHDSTTAVPKNTGSNQLWSFVSLTANTQTEVITYTTAASVPQSSLFTGATLSALRGTNNREFFMSSGSDFYFMGDYRTTNGDLFILSNTALFMTWPVSISSTFSDVAVGTQVASSNSTALTGTLMYHASGAGTVILPGGAVHNNCLQITNTLVVVTGTGSSATTMTQISYRYYSSANKFHIAEVQYSQESGPGGTSKEFSAYFERTGTTGLSELLVSHGLQLYPNPAGDLVCLSLTGADQLRDAKVIDVQGRVVLSSDQALINISSLPSGIYSVAVATTDAVHVRRLVISK